MEEVNVPEKEEKIEKFDASKTLSKGIDRLFSMKRHTIILIAIIFFGFILRLIAVADLSVSADMMHFVTHAINFFDSGKLVDYGQSAGLWQAFTSIIYKIFGTTQFASRFAALLFGTFSIPVIYLLSKEFFDEKVSLFAAFLLAISIMHIKNTVAEMDVMAMFFVLTSMFLFVKALKSEKPIAFAISGIFLGVAIYTKVYPLLFIPSMLIFGAVFKYYKGDGKKVFSKQNAKLALFFLVAIFLFCIPALAHNYLLYKDKGFMDLQFTRTLGLGKNISEQYYGWDHQFNAKSDWAGFFFGNSTNSGSPLPSAVEAGLYLPYSDPIIFILGIIGIIFLFLCRKDKSYLAFYILSVLFIFPFLASIILLSKHYIFLSILFVPLAAFGLDELLKRISSAINKNQKQIQIILLIIIIISTFIILGFTTSAGEKNYWTSNHISEMISFKDDKIPANALIVADSRMYRGRINWFAQGRPYLEGTEFVEVVNQLEAIQGKPIVVDTFFFECVPDDCGWGTVKNNPQLNSTMEQTTEFFKQKGTLVKTIYERNPDKPYVPIIIPNEKRAYINIYQAKIQLKDTILSYASQPKEWFLYTIGYQPVTKQFDYYDTNSLLDKALQQLARLVEWIALIIAFLSPIYIIYLLCKKHEKHKER